MSEITAFVPYTKKIWNNGEKILADSLNNMENAIKNLSDQIEQAIGTETNLSDRFNHFNTATSPLYIEDETEPSLKFLKNNVQIGEIVGSNYMTLNVNRIISGQATGKEIYRLPYPDSHDNDITYSILTSKDALLKNSVGPSQILTYTFPQSVGSGFIFINGSQDTQQGILTCTWSGGTNGGDTSIYEIYTSQTKTFSYEIDSNNSYNLIFSNSGNTAYYIAMLVIFQTGPSVSIATAT